jgi:hypothetical protein
MAGATLDSALVIFRGERLVLYANRRGVSAVNCERRKAIQGNWIATAAKAPSR